MIVRKRKSVMIEVEVEVAAEWSGESGGGKPSERWIESLNWKLVKLDGTLCDTANAFTLDAAEVFEVLLWDAVRNIPEEELAE